jgi:hypothetical protein
MPDPRSRRLCRTDLPPRHTLPTHHQPPPRPRAVPRTNPVRAAVPGVQRRGIASDDGQQASAQLGYGVFLEWSA